MNARTFTLLVCSLFAPAVASAEVVIYDDSLAPGWRADWGQSQSTFTLGNTGSALMTGQPWGQNGQVVLKHDGLTIGQNSLLQFYVNTSDDTAATGLTLKLNNNLEYHLNGGGIYTVDGVEQIGSFSTDANSSTWQLVTFDLFQPRYFWSGGWMSTSLTSTDQLTALIWAKDEQLLIDSISLTTTPEPATLSLLGLGGLALLKRRRAW